MTKEELLERNENNFNYHPASDEEKKDAHARVRLLCRALANELVEMLPLSRELGVALTHLEDVMMWSNAAIARNDGFVSTEEN